jgi:energy-converting hydrogenase Eha subunit F
VYVCIFGGVCDSLCVYVRVCLCVRVCVCLCLCGMSPPWEASTMQTYPTPRPCPHTNTASPRAAYNDQGRCQLFCSLRMLGKFHKQTHTYTHTHTHTNSTQLRKGMTITTKRDQLWPRHAIRGRMFVTLTPYTHTHTHTHTYLQTHIRHKAAPPRADGNDRGRCHLLC